MVCEELKIQEGQQQLVQLALCCKTLSRDNTESDKEGEGICFSTHLSGSRADLSIKKAALCKLIELYKTARGNGMMKNKVQLWLKATAAA